MITPKEEETADVSRLILPTRDETDRLPRMKPVERDENKGDHWLDQLNY
jgi:hypothetical protein